MSIYREYFNYNIINSSATTITLLECKLCLFRDWKQMERNGPELLSLRKRASFPDTLTGLEANES
jgi:hypothetical protein